MSYNAGVYGGVIVHLGFLPSTIAPNGFYIFGGTSAGAPQMAAIATITNQFTEEPAGFLNPGIYELGRFGLLKFLTHDVTVGDNSQFGIIGYTATPGWDLATGWGTPNKGFALALGID